ncbi:MAG: substrate-binding domain-containing protein [Saprospiraceae bacterium]|nr:substrate-binding domain-containing protein [Saprospiraceae bacterium]
MIQRIRIKDIAAQTGVSIGTVDRVIHNRGNVAQDVRVRILQVMQEMGYEPNMMARSLANNKKTLRIAALLPDYRDDLYWVQPKAGAEKAAEVVRQYGVQVDFYFFPLFDPGGYLRTAQRAIDAAPDAVFLAPLFLAESEQLIRYMTRLGIPKVMINSNIAGTDALCYIGQDSYQRGVLAGRLLGFGLRDGDHALVLNLDKNVSNARHLIDKERGFKDFFEQVENKSIEVHAAAFEEFDDPVRLRDWVAGQLDQYPRLNGFFVTNSRAYKLVQALPPALHQRVKIVGFDLIEPNIALLKANKIRFLINQNAWHQGYLAVMAIVKTLIWKKDIPPLQYLPLDIVVPENAEYYLNRSPEIPMVLV